MSLPLGIFETLPLASLSYSFDKAPRSRPAVNIAEMQTCAKREEAIIISDSSVTADSASGYAGK